MRLPGTCENLSPFPAVRHANVTTRSPPRRSTPPRRARFAALVCRHASDSSTVTHVTPHSVGARLARRRRTSVLRRSRVSLRHSLARHLQLRHSLTHSVTQTNTSCHRFVVNVFTHSLTHSVHSVTPSLARSTLTRFRHTRRNTFRVTRKRVRTRRKNVDENLHDFRRPKRLKNVSCFRQLFVTRSDTFSSDTKSVLRPDSATRRHTFFRHTKCV